MTTRRLTNRSGAALMLAWLMTSPSAAEAESETEVWLSAEVSGEIIDDLNIGVSQDVRWDDDVGRLHEMLSGVSLSYRGIRRLRLGVGYRAEQVQSRRRGWELGHRLHVEARSGFDAGPLGLSYRLRVQATKDSDKRVTFWSPAMRHRVRVAYEDFGDLRPFVDTELFVGLGQPDGFGLSKWRARVGVAYDFGDHEIGLFYLAQRRVGDASALRHDVLGIGYEFGF